MAPELPSPACEGGAGRACLAAGARPIFSSAALAAQCPIIFTHWLREPLGPSEPEQERETRQ